MYSRLFPGLYFTFSWTAMSIYYIRLMTIHLNKYSKCSYNTCSITSRLLHDLTVWHTCHIVFVRSQPPAPNQTLLLTAADWEECLMWDTRSTSCANQGTSWLVLEHECAWSHSSGVGRSQCADVSYRNFTGLIVQKKKCNKYIYILYLCILAKMFL